MTKILNWLADESYVTDKHVTVTITEVHPPKNNGNEEGLIIQDFMPVNRTWDWVGNPISDTAKAAGKLMHRTSNIFNG